MTSTPRSDEDVRRGREQLVRAWTEQLYLEYDNLLFQFRLKLKAPQIKVDPSTSRWGSWHPHERMITISERLIERYSWDIVLEILKHEIAHQIVTEMWRGDHRHGLEFARACRLLGVADWAAKAGGALPEEISTWQNRAVSLEEERLLKRVEKLLSLAASANEHEAVLAMRRVQELYTRYNLTRIERRDEPEMVYLFITRKKKRTTQAESVIFSILAEHFFVKTIYNRLYDAKDLCEYRAVELLGTRENVQMAEYVYHFLWNQTESLWRAFKKTSGLARAAKGSYVLGVLAGFRTKLALSRKETLQAAVEGDPVASTALMTLADQQLDTYIETRHPRLAKRQWSTGFRDADSFAAGVDDGQRLNLHKGLTHQSGNKGLRLATGVAATK